jgi:hypothetical protein
VDAVLVEEYKMLLFHSLTVISDDIVALVASQRQMDLHYFHLWQSNDCHYLSLLTVTKVVDLLFARIA